MQQVTIPPNDTTYWCTVHELPEDIVHQERFIYKVTIRLQVNHPLKAFFQMSPVMSESSSQFVHHLLIYLCTDLDHLVGRSGSCRGDEIDLTLCLGAAVILGGWAVGGTVSDEQNKCQFPEL